MDCRSCQSLLSAYVDDQLVATDARRLHVHLSGCSDCSAELNLLLGTLQLLRSLPRPRPTADPWEAIAFTLRREGLVRPWYRRARPLGVAAAAAVVIVAGSYVIWRPTSQSASLEAYWRQHAIFAAQEAPALSTGAPSLDAIEATYQLEGDDR
jgi:anti-sigma factor RsiW